MGGEDETQARGPNFAAFLFLNGGWFLVSGVQMVLFPYLIRAVLHENEVRFGFAQMCLQLPTTLLILVGGFVADRIDGRRIIVGALAAMALTFGVLGAVVAAGRLNYGLMIAYALAIGVASAFGMPARDAILSQVAPDPENVQGAVAKASLAQFGGQILGMLAAMAAPFVGVIALLLGQAVLMGSATFAAMGMRPRPAERRAPAVGHPFAFLAGQITEGFRAAVASPVIAPVLVLSVGMGVCFMGAFSVLLPLLVQTYFPTPADGKADPAVATAIGAFVLCFWVGSMISAMALMRRGPMARPGGAYLLALTTGGAVLLVCAIPMPLWALCAMNFIWGLGGGVAMTLGRGFIQRHAPPEKRARVLSIFTLGNMGGAPVGAVAYGYLAHAIGPRLSLLIPGGLMLMIVAVVALRSRLLSIREGV